MTLLLLQKDTTALLCMYVAKLCKWHACNTYKYCNFMLSYYYAEAIKLVVWVIHVVLGSCKLINLVASVNSC